MNILDKRFDITKEEMSFMRSIWQQKKKQNTGRTKKFKMVLPPPNVTGSLHMGHGLTFTLQDVLLRYYHMKGYEVITQAGFDHAGISTQLMINKTYGNIKSYEEFQKISEIWIAEYRGRIEDQLQQLGLFINWDNLSFTLDEDRSKSVMFAFVDLYKRGLIYKGETIVNWDTKFQTAISDLEVSFREEKQELYYIDYAGEGFSISVATSRPETIFGDCAIAVNPTDIRYSKYLGKTVFIPIVNRKIPIIPSLKVDIKYGTGSLKVTPAHDFDDFEICKKNKLDIFNIIDEKGCLTSKFVPEDFQGLKCKDARIKIKDMLNLKTTPIVSRVPYGEKSNTIIEPRLTEQWFFSCKEFAEKSVEQVKSGEVQIVPDYWKNTFYNWNENIKEWCISRQIWWGHKIPAWYDENNNIYVAETYEEALAEAKTKIKNPILTQDVSVLDTWFSSSLFHLSSLEWPHNKEKYVDNLPASIVVTAYDILFFWISRMMIMSNAFNLPKAFEKIFIHCLVRDKDGQKMSKTKGNVLDPLVLMEKYGVDVVRCGLVMESNIYHDLKISEEKFIDMNKFITKLWNSARYIIMNSSDVIKKVDFSKQIFCGHDIFSHYIVSSIEDIEQSVSALIEDCQIKKAFIEIYSYIWDHYCRWFIEIHKLKNLEDSSVILIWSLGKILKMLHPFAPYVTEKIWGLIGFKNESILDNNLLNEKIVFEKRYVDQIKKVLSLTVKIRRIKKIFDIRDNEINVYTNNKDFKDLIKKNTQMFTQIVGCLHGNLSKAAGIIINVDGAEWKIESEKLTVNVILEKLIYLKRIFLVAKEQNSSDCNRVESDIKQIEEIKTLNGI
jgi:valyl-tRNA synthetase